MRLQSVEAEASQVEEQEEKGGIVEDAAAGILSQIEALKSTLGLE